MTADAFDSERVRYAYWMGRMEGMSMSQSMSPSGGMAGD